MYSQYAFDYQQYMPNLIKISWFVGIILLSYFSNLIAKRYILTSLKSFVEKTKVEWDNILFKRNVFTRLSHIVPALLIYLLGPLVFRDHPIIANIIVKFTNIYIVFIFILVINSFLSAFNDIYNRFDIAKIKSIKGYIQVIKILVTIIGLIIIVATLFNRSPIYLLTGLGAVMAVLILVFKDTLLGFTGSIIISANDMVRPGDWISVPKHDADGDVIELSLTTVKIRNWDKTISMVPTYSLVSGSFKNWRGMQETGGRRIKRHVSIDINTIKFLNDADIEKYKKIEIVEDYLTEIQVDIKKFNTTQSKDHTHQLEINGRNLTNIGVFRKYLELYLRDKETVHPELTFIIRQLQSTEKGVPLQIYLFVNDVRWVHYEEVQSDIFDHVLASVKYFDLKIFQYAMDEYN